MVWTSRMFYHPGTEGGDPRSCASGSWTGGLGARRADAWIRMVATNRLTGHSPGFFSVYTLPPNQALTRGEAGADQCEAGPGARVPGHPCPHPQEDQAAPGGPTRRSAKHLAAAAEDAVFCTGDARPTGALLDTSVQLTVTSPPFLDVVNYPRDNWLRCWFCGLDAEAIGGASACTHPRRLVGHHGGRLRRTVPPDEPGRLRGLRGGGGPPGKLRLDETPALGLGAGFKAHGVLVNAQSFTKTANIWGVSNNPNGTNSNRIVLFEKP